MENLDYAEGLDYIQMLVDSQPDKPIGTPGPSCKRESPRTLVCHDMKNGYAETSDPYIFWNWAYVDVFVYFSHHFITLPPRWWIESAAAQRTGIQVLGTLITEWERGSQICEQFLSDEASYTQLAKQLAEIARRRGFHGWLINIENPIKDTNKLIEFVRTLRVECKAQVGEGSFVIWYDGVVSGTGELEWQNELNEKNSPFFMAADAIFLNYCWNPSNLYKSATRCASLGKQKNDVFVGLDCWGRGLLGGGEWNMSSALRTVRQSSPSLSVALFGQAWCYEKLVASLRKPGCDYLALQDTYYALAYRYLNCHPIIAPQKHINFDFQVGLHKPHGCNALSISIFPQTLQPHDLCHPRCDFLSTLLRGDCVLPSITSVKPRGARSTYSRSIRLNGGRWQSQTVACCNFPLRNLEAIRLEIDFSVAPDLRPGSVAAGAVLFFDHPKARQIGKHCTVRVSAIPNTKDIYLVICENHHVALGALLCSSRDDCFRRGLSTLPLASKMMPLATDYKLDSISLLLRNERSSTGEFVCKLLSISFPAIPSEESLQN